MAPAPTDPPTHSSPSTESPGSLANDALIIGCGYVGRRLAERLLKRGVTVWGTCRQPHRAQELADLGVRPMLVSVTQRLTLAALSPALSRPSLDVYYLVPPGRSGADPSPKEVLLEGVANVVAHLKQANIRRAVLTSSTAVYGQSEGQAVDASSEAQPPQERGQWLVQAERIWLESPLPSQVVRLAGIYGPGRVIGQRAVREGQPLVGDPHAYLNLIHVDDVVELLLTLVSSRDAAPIELGCDDQPPKRLEYYHELAKRLGVSPPRVMSEPEMVSLGIPLNLERLRRSSNKICVNTPTRERTGWVPQYPSYHQGLTHALG